jgi:hypothetical protein
LRRLKVDRAHLVGAAAIVSLAADVSKTAVFAITDLLRADAFILALLATPLMIVATGAGRMLNTKVGERGYAALFWGVIAGYILRLAF